MKHTQDGITVSIEHKEEYQHYRNHNDDKASRFVKRAVKSITIFGVEYSESFNEVVSFLISVLRVFLQNKMGKHIYTWYVQPDYAKHEDYHGSGPCENSIVAWKREESGDQVLMIDSVDEEGQVLHSQMLDLRACMQLEMVLRRIFSFIIPENPMTEEDIEESNKEVEWARLSEYQQEEIKKEYLRKRKQRFYKNPGHNTIPNNVIRLIDRDPDGVQW